LRAARVVLAGLLGLVALAIAAAWLVPPRLDWNRYRPTIETVASRMLGQTVRIEGEVALTLLPSPALIADRVTLGEGVLSVGALRLRAALAPLLAGRIEPRELVLQSPRLALAWPPPSGLAPPSSWPAGLAVRIEDGAATFGTFAISDLQATASVGETGALAIAGRGLVTGRAWAFTARLTAFGPDGSSGVDAGLDGTGALAGTSARFTGQLAGLTGLSGTATVAGADLSALIPAPKVAFRAQGRVTAADGLVAADDLAIELAGNSARAAVALRLLPIQRLDLSLAIGRLDLAAWLRPLLHPPPGGAWALPVGLDLSAEAADLAGGTLRRLRFALDLTPQAAELREASAILPGAASVSLTGRITRGEEAAFAGAGHLDAPDLPATAAWAASAFGLPVAVAGRLPRAAAVAGQITATSEQVTLDTLAGTLDGGDVSGAISLHPGPSPALAVTARLARLDLDPWLPDGPPRWPAPGDLGGLATLGLDLQAAAATWRGVALRDLAIAADAEPGTLRLHRLEVRLAGARLAASGAIDAARGLADGRFELNAERAASLAAPLAAWFGASATEPWLRHLGALRIGVSAAGPPAAIAGRVEAHGIGAARLSADAVLDSVAGVLRATVTMAHPSAGAMLAVLGWPMGGEGWLGAGKLAARADVTLRADRLETDRLTLQAGLLHGQGALTLDWQGPRPRLTGRFDAATLPLPSLVGLDEGRLGFDGLSGWEAALDVTADRILVGPKPVASAARARLGVAEGVLGIGGFTARVAGGDLVASAAIDGLAAPPTVQADLALNGMAIEGAVTGAAIDLVAGTASARLRLSAAGYGMAALRATLQGRASLDVAHGVAQGFDLGRLGVALMRAGPDSSAAELTAALAPALSGGRCIFDTLHLEAELSAGALALRAALLSGPDGQVTAAGVVGLGGEGMDVRLALRPAIPAGGAAGVPEVGERLTGPAAAPTRTPELSGVLRWLSRG
jgi:uncharacterized protein involved in outer membrane biogenesis